jgi:hypothetical protein
MLADPEESTVTATEGQETTMEKLRKVAEQATEGSWRADYDNVWSEGPGIWVCEACDGHSTAEHIATFDPPTVLALLDVAEAAEAAVDLWTSDRPHDDDGQTARLHQAVDRLRAV